MKNVKTLWSIVLIAAVAAGIVALAVLMPPKDMTPTPITIINSTDNNPEPVAPRQQGACYVGGCSGQICSDRNDVVSTCEWTESYACYKSATCERQANGQCGWTETSALRACLNSAGTSAAVY